MTAGYCILCMGDLPLAPKMRFRQFLDRFSWRDHVNKHFRTHIQNIEAGKPALCPHPYKQCVTKLEWAKQFEFYFLNVHCPKFIIESNILNFPKKDEEITPPPKKKAIERRHACLKGQIRGRASIYRPHDWSCAAPYLERYHLHQFLKTSYFPFSITTTAACPKTELLINDAIITTCNNPPARLNMDFLSLREKDDDPRFYLQDSNQNPSLDEIVVNISPLHRRTSSPKSQSLFRITVQTKPLKPVQYRNEGKVVEQK